MRNAFLRPKKPLKKNKDIEDFIANVVFEIQKKLCIAGYKLFVFMPDDEGWRDDAEASYTIRVEYPYKKIKLSVQRSTVEKLRNIPITSHYFINNTHSLIHEMVHVILWDLVEVAQARCITRREIDDMDEKTTDHLANVIHDLIA